MSNHADFKVKNGLVVNTTATFLTTVTSTSTTSGGIIISGGVGIAKDVWIGGTLNIANASSATSTTTGAVQVIGGVGIQGDLYARNLYSNGVLVGTNANISTTATNLAGGSTNQIPYQSTAGITSFVLPPPSTTNSLLQFSTGTGFTWTSTSSVGGGFFFYSPITGVFTATGVTTTFVLSTTPTSKDYVNIVIDGVTQLQNAYSIFNNTIVFSEIPSTGSNIEIRTVNVISTTTMPAFGVTGQIQYNVNGYISGTTFMSYNTATGVVSITPGVQTYSTNSGALQVIGGVGIGGNLYVGGTVTATSFVGNLTGSIAGGSVGALLYQSSTSTTGFISIGTNGYVLTSNGIIPTWTPVSGVTSGNATNAANISTIQQTSNANYYLTFVNANNTASTNMAVYTTSSFVINPSTGYVGINSTSTAARRLEVLDSDNPQLRLTQAVGTYTDFQTNSSGNLNITPTGGRVILPTSSGYLDVSAGTILLGPNGFGVVGDVVFRSTGAANSTVSPVFKIKDSTGSSQESLRFSPTWTNSTPGSLALTVAVSSLGFTITNYVVTTSSAITTFVSTSSSTSTTTGALQVIGGIGVGGSIYVGNRVGFVNTSNISTVYQYYNATTNSLDTVFG